MCVSAFAGDEYRTRKSASAETNRTLEVEYIEYKAIQRNPLICEVLFHWARDFYVVTSERAGYGLIVPTFSGDPSSPKKFTVTVADPVALMKMN